MGKKKKGSRIGNPVARAAVEVAERKRIVDIHAKATSCRNKELIGDDVLDVEDFDEAEDLMDSFCAEYPQWLIEDGREQSWELTSQIIRAFDGFLLWRKEAAKDGTVLDINRCFEVNNVTDVAQDVREFLIKQGLIGTN